MLPKKEEPKKGAPGYIVSMSSLWTIMLTFFISLCNMANEREYGLIGAGTGSFIQQINAEGKPGILPGTRTTADLGEGRPQFAIPPRALEQGSDTDADILYRRIISIEPMRLPRAIANEFRTRSELRIPVSLKFTSGKAELTNDDRATLLPLRERLRLLAYYVRIEVAVSSAFVFNTDYASPWELSAARAAAIAHYFNDGGLGLSYRRMEPIGLGNARPALKGAASSDSGDRVEIIIEKE